MNSLEYIADLEMRVALLEQRIRDASATRRSLRDWFCAHAMRAVAVALLATPLVALLIGRGGLQPLLAGLNVAGLLLMLRLAFCKELPELRCALCGRNIARPLLAALAALFGLFAAGHLTGIEVLMTLAAFFEHASLFVVAILGNRHWECLSGLMQHQR